MGKTYGDKSIINSLLQYIVWIGIFLSLLTPLAVNLKMMYPFMGPRLLFFMGVVQVMFFAWLVLAIFDKKYRPNKNAITLSVLAFIVIAFVSAVSGFDFEFSFWSNFERGMGLFMHLHIFAFFLVLSSFIKKRSDWMMVFSAISIIASAVALVSIGNVYGFFELASYYKNGSTLGNTSFMGSYLLVAIFFAFYGLLKSQKPIQYFYLINFIIIALGILTNPGGRAMKGAFLAGMILFFLLYYAFKNQNKYIKIGCRAILILGFFFSIVIGVSAFIDGNPVREKIFGLHGMAPRFTVWDISWQSFKEKPMLGWGIENYRVPFERKFEPKLLLQEYGAEVWFDRAHNVVFDSLVAFGLIGTIIFFMMFAVAIYALWRYYLKEDRDIIAPAVFTSLFVAHFIQNLTVFDMVASYMLIFLAFAFISFNTSKEEVADDEKKEVNLVVLLIITIVFTISFIAGISKPYNANHYGSMSLSAPIDFEDTLDYFETTISVPMGRENFLLSITDRVIALSNKGVVAEIEDEELRSEQISFEIHKMEYLIEKLEGLIEKDSVRFKDYWTLSKLYNHYFDYYHLEQLIADNNEENRELAMEAISRALEVAELGLAESPKNVQGYWEVAQAKINIGKIYYLSLDFDTSEKYFLEAFELLEDAVDLEPRFLSSHEKLIRTADQVLVDKELAKEKALEAVEINPDWEESFKEYYGN